MTVPTNASNHAGAPLRRSSDFDAEIDYVTSDLSLRSLSPRFVPDSHRLPLDILSTAVDDRRSRQARPKNIAVSGPYGSGKSSVLDELVKMHPRRTINISLSALSFVPDNLNSGVDEIDFVTHATDRGVSTTFLQKEIVKQLLYREKPSSVPDSRFRRIVPRNPTTSLVVGAAVSVTMFFILVLIQLPQLVADRLFHNVLASGACFVALASVFVGIISGRLFGSAVRHVDLREMSAGVASITLEPKQSNYFDQFLDEIIYYFQQTSVDILIFEDLDRFDNPRIYESLRSLNAILNTSRQVGRVIQMVYAVRDSLFDANELPHRHGPEVDELGSRTKFFDLIIPLVPFINRDNAVDLLSPELENLAHAPDASVIEIVAPHLADMRLLLNVRNEYAIFSGQLLGTSTTLAGLNAQSLFAMVAYKNLAPTQFELIRRQQSEIDIFFNAVRKGSVARLGTLQEELSRLNTALDAGEPSSSEAEQLTEKARAVFETLHRAQYGGSAALVSLSLEAADSIAYMHDLRTGSRWPAIFAAKDVVGNLNDGVSITIGQTDWLALLGGATADYAPTQNESDSIVSRIRTVEKHIKLLRGASLIDCMMDDSLTITYGGAPYTYTTLFDEIVHAGAEMVFQLVMAGHIDRNYALYSAHYYGLTTSVNAMTFAIQSIQPNVADVFYAFETADEVDSIIRQYGQTLFSEEAGMNVALVERLCETRDPLLAASVEFLARTESESDEARQLIEAMVERSVFREPFIAELSAFWSHVIPYLVAKENLHEDHHLGMLNAALGRIRIARYFDVPNTAIVRRVRAAPELLTAIESNSVHADTTIIAHQTAALKVQLRDLGTASVNVRLALAEAGAWQVNEVNLLEVGGLGRIPTLAELRTKSEDLFLHVMANYSDYVSTMQSVRQPIVNSEKDFAWLAGRLAVTHSRYLDGFIESVRDDVEVEVLERTPRQAWDALMTRGMVVINADNVQRYLREAGGTVTPALAECLKTRSASGLVLNEPESLVAVLNSDLLRDEEIRNIALNAAATQVSIEALDGNGMPFVPDILGLHLADTAQVFTASMAFKVALGISVVAASNEFGNYIGAVAWNDKWAAAVLSAPDVSQQKKQILVAYLSSQGKPGKHVSAVLLKLLDDAFLTPDVNIFVWLALVPTNHEKIVRSLSLNLNYMPLPDLNAVLLSLGGVYESLVRGTRNVQLPRNDHHRVIANHLKDNGGRVAKVTAAREGYNVWMR
jgi:hypothetical protein